MVQKVAVIGAGISGLTSIKACLDEGLEPTCFESSHDIGGLLRFKEKPEPGRANIYQSVVITSSKEIMSLSDFPPLQLSSVCEACVRVRVCVCQTTVVSVRQTPDSAATGQWEVETERREGQRETRVFDAVMVCTGHFTQPHLPLSDFPGTRNHYIPYFLSHLNETHCSCCYSNSYSLTNVYLSTRSGAWVVSRVGQRGLPADLVGTSRMDMMIQKLFPSWINGMVEKKLDETFDHALYDFFEQIPVVNDDLPARIISGRVQVKPNVKEFCGSSVVFVDGSIIDEVDVVVFATGYNYSFPFLPPALQAKSGYRLRLYKHVFPPALTQPTLAVVGFIHSLGAINPLAEMQARWATRVFKGFTTLPSEETMMKEIEKDTQNPLQVDYIPYLDSLAEQVGVRPNILWLFLKDPRLALEVWLGPCTPYQYRLTGPGRWAGARQAILTQWERVLQPFRTRLVPKPETRASSRRSVIVVISGSALLCCFYYNKHLLSSFFSPLAFLRSPQYAA
uniref:Flavin-containing monooxygenase n=1 Tax=Sander lucioperca TaxID=283035 RepID=A0A8D0AC41_SANLU